MALRCTRLTAVALLGWSLNSPSAPAQNFAPPAPAHMPQAIVVHQGPEVPEASQRNRPLHRLLNNHGMSCQAHPSDLGCGSFWTEMSFIFSSCRTFYRQPCIPNPPHSARQHGAGSIQP